jgi:sulfur transfer ThiS family protein
VAVILLPSLLATEAGGRRRFESDAATVKAALTQLPVADLLFDERGELRSLVNVYVDGVDVRDRGGLDAPAGESEIRVVAAVAGGCS